MRRRSTQSRHGFTLVELLVVIGIIALLISILMPALTKARNQALAVKCGNQVRQIYMACLMHAQDNKGHLPRASVGPGTDPTGRPDSEKTCAFTHDATTGEWGILDYNKGVLVPYIPGGFDVRKDTFYCPGDLGEVTMGGGPPSSDKRNVSYSFNAHINRPDIDGQHVLGIRIGSVAHAAQKIFIFEEQAPNDLWCLLWDLGDTNTAPHEFRRDDILSARHAGQKYVNATRTTSPGTSEWRMYGPIGRANYGFFDGHVEILTPNDIMNRPKYFMLNVRE